MNESVVTFHPDDRSFVYAVVRRIVPAAEDAEDVTQEALLLAYRYRDSFRGDSRYRTWLYRIAASAALGHLRKEKRHPREALDEQMPDPVPSSETQVANAEMRALVYRALHELQPAYRDVLVAREEATEPEVAQQLGISVANVKIRAHRARKALRAVLSEMIDVERAA